MAAQSWRLLASLPRTERAAIHAIRRGCTPTIDTGSALHGLAALCRDRALRIGHPESAFVTSDERLLLAALAVQQRSSSDTSGFTCPALGKALADGALALADIGLRPVYNATKVALLREHGWMAPVHRLGLAGDAGTAREGTAKWSVIQHARGRTVMSSAELQGLGITRQYVSRLCRTGVLERVNFGHYRLGRHTMEAGTTGH